MSDATEAYRAAGVDLDLGNDVSNMLYEVAKQTWSDREGRIGEVREYGTGFSSFRAMPLDVIGAPGYLQSVAADGVGTKIEVAERMEDHRTIGHDLIAMACDDAIIRGAEPYAVATILDVRKFKDVPRLPELLGQLATGYMEAALAADVAIVDGETAELGARVDGYGSFNYNWSACALWMIREERIIDETLIKPGDALVAFKEHGFRSNGLSMVRNVFSKLLQDDWHNFEIPPSIPHEAGNKLGELVLRPSIIYSKAVVDMTGGSSPLRQPKARIHGAAHITGGGIPEKLGRMLKNTGYGAVIEEPYNLPYAMRLVQEEYYRTGEGDLSDEALYRTFNGGQGMIIATPEPENVRAVAAAHGIESKDIGKIVKTPGIVIKSRAHERDKPLEFAA